jgi:heme-degrading monooxygenase HmoA
MNPLAPLPEPPYYAVIFASKRTPEDTAGYAAAAERMEVLATKMPGFLGIDSARSTDGVGITVSYWASEAAISAWREEAEHRLTQAMGRAKWYECFTLRVCRVERAYGFEAGKPASPRIAD